MSPDGARRELEVAISLGGVDVRGDLEAPPGASGLVVFVHGSGSSRFSSRNRYVAEVIRSRGLGTLLFDLLTVDEEQVDQLTAQYRFDIDLLTERVLGVTEWLREDAETKGLRIGYFGASTGAAAALAAAARTDGIAAVVSRGGRPDLASTYLPLVKTPTLLIVGGDDPVVISMNQEALGHLGSVKELRIVPGATHLFEEPGTLEKVARLASDWFARYMAPATKDAGTPL